MTHFPEVPDELLARLDVPGPRYTSYPTAPVWSPAGATDHARALERAAVTPERPLSLYLHIPFCRQMCSYCGCNVVVSRDPERVENYLAALIGEVHLAADRLGARRRLSRLHLGGGTPTFLTERQLATLWRAITDRFALLPGAEVAVEIDPASTRPEKIALLAMFGFNRLSMGVQDLDPTVQATVERIQSVEETRAATEEARALGFRSVNFDLIYGLPRQTPERWRRTMEQVVALSPDRVAAFSFAFLPDALPNQRRLPAAEVPRGAAKLALLAVAHDALVDAGYRAIGMDHFARPGDELALAQERRELWRDFQGYTTERAPDTIALGASAISDVGGAYLQNARALGDYRAAVIAGRLPTARGHALSEEDRRRRGVIMDLMCNFTADASAFPDERARLGPLVRDGLLSLDGTRLLLTPLGRVFVRNVAMVFDAYLSRPSARAFSQTV